MKHKKALCLLAPIMAFSVLMAGCSLNSVSVTSIEKTASYATEDVYTVYYSDGSSSSFTVQHGTSVTVQDLFDRYQEEYGDSLTYQEFLEKYLTGNAHSQFAVGTALLSSFKISAAASATTVQQGSGVLYAVNGNDAYILTNYHVTYISSSRNGAVSSDIACSLYGSDQTTFPCTYIGGSASSDIALLRANLAQIQAVNPNVKPVTFAKSYCVGETVYAIGNAEGEGISATTGIVSVDSEQVSLSVDGTTRKHRVMRIDAAIYHGNSGGGLFNSFGELIGITNSGDEKDQNINYAIPLSIVKGTADNILHYAADDNSRTTGAYKVSLGVTATTQNSRYVYNEVTGTGYIKEDIIVKQVNAFSIASSLGLKTNDILTAIEVNGTKYPLNRDYEIYDILLTVRSGDELKVSYTRSGAAGTSSAYTVQTSDLKKID